jgi:uncharacterized membrane protein YwzB
MFLPIGADRSCLRIGVVASDIFAVAFYWLTQPIWIDKYLKELEEGGMKHV